MDKHQLSECSTTWLSLILVLVSSVTSMGPLKPMHIDYAITRLTQRQIEQFVDEHNRFRSLANPPAANMEYMVRTWFLFVAYFMISYAWYHKWIIKFLRRLKQGHSWFLQVEIWRPSFSFDRSFSLSISYVKKEENLSIRSSIFLQNASSNSVMFSSSFICAAVWHASWRVRFCVSVDSSLVFQN